MVTKKRMNQYNSRMGQKTGTSNKLKKVMQKPTRTDFMEEYLQGKVFIKISTSLVRCQKNAAHTRI
jgi:hypothetical protein